ncbi:hypothetical protein LG3211_1489 [Lysobacter gummosus]|nr:hypothetical protein LG3211_1489 [Lysobacter gummosus]
MHSIGSPTRWMECGCARPRECAQDSSPGSNGRLIGVGCMFLMCQ